MISSDDLKMFKIFDRLNNKALSEIAKILKPVEISEHTTIFREGENSEHLYFLISGKVLLEQKLTSSVTITVDTLKPGEIFGTASIMDIPTYTINAVTSENSNIFVVDSHKFINLMEKDNSIGYKILKELCIQTKKQLTERTALLSKSISSHPDFDSL